ncbi:hypothetical protein KC207_08640 [Phycicoccus sp. BSK3Z-2]|uniref:Uncharacterized protein n=1 Tax=Phycicoccus avicenniae TaxID=2828860 RepID=A0A941D759_9MICO|nr:hypothetical protein [Phycicoccus avicenniae]MBR7743354.1 hypothetical protein [Phycicoccus avicenniae]
MSDTRDPRDAGADGPGGDGPLLPGAPLPDEVQRHLRRSMEMLRERADDPAVRRRIDDVLAGRASLRDLARDDGFDRFMEPLVRRGMQRLDELSPQEREAAERGAAALARGEKVPEPDADRASRPRPPDLGTW